MCRGQQMISVFMGQPLSDAPQSYLTCFDQSRSLEQVFLWGEFYLHPLYDTETAAKEMFLQFETQLKQSQRYTEIVTYRLDAPVDNQGETHSYDVCDAFLQAMGFVKREDLRIQLKWGLDSERKVRTFCYWWKPLN